MEYTRLRTTGLKVSRLALGCMSYGDATPPNAHSWALTEDTVGAFFRQAVELGIRFWDTTNVYQAGSSEEFVAQNITSCSQRSAAPANRCPCRTRPACGDGPAGLTNPQRRLHNGLRR